MSKFPRVSIAAFGLMLSLAGCGGFRAGPTSPFGELEASLSRLETTYSADRIVACLSLPLREEAPQEPHRECRDRIIQGLMAAIDVRYAIFEQELLDAQRFTGLGGTVLQLGLTGAATVATGGAPPILAAIATALNGTQEAIGRDILVNRTVTALQTAMQARRNEVALRLVEGQKRTAAQYPLGTALSDLLAYYRAGTLAGGAVALNEAAGAQRQQARSDLNRGLGLTRTGLEERRTGSVPEVKRAGISGAAGAAPRPLANPPAPASEQDRIDRCIIRLWNTTNKDQQQVETDQARLRQAMDAQNLAVRMDADGIARRSQLRRFVTDPAYRAQRALAGQTLCPASPPTAPDAASANGTPTSSSAAPVTR